MPKLGKRWNDIDEMSGGFSDIEPGAYVLEITKCMPNVAEQYFELTWDVAEGERKGAYANSQYPPTTRVYWRDTTLGYLKHRLHVLADWNPGFKSTVAFEGDQWGLFVGKKFGAVVRKRLYTAGPNSKNPGADRYSMEVALWLSPEDFKAGKFNKSMLEDNDMRDKSAVAQAPAQVPAPPASVPNTYAPAAEVYDEDIPF